MPYQEKSRFSRWIEPRDAHAAESEILLQSTLLHDDRWTQSSATYVEPRLSPVTSARHIVDVLAIEPAAKADQRANELASQR